MITLDRNFNTNQSSKFEKKEVKDYSLKMILYENSFTHDLYFHNKFVATLLLEKTTKEKIRFMLKEIKNILADFMYF